ncbi:GNAT family N-acetyltransferase [Streptococcus ictaluri]|uniref:Acetyltransferase, GNAT family n=1 Tax=Streptococcus ictaluri 707-05 TaxID=764299 RepID=G5K143_9STRE|nr:GNAT family protein [Streptococcus ictaluri]EHI70329.1 acetyltransferase, GNAT family [Streptococcus ictaluri 707-05]
MDAFVRIDTERLSLRPVRLSDAEAMYEYGHCPEVARLAGFPVNQSVEECQAFIEMDLDKKGDAVRQRIYAICLKGKDRLMGTVNFAKAITSDILEIGYVLHPDLWGQGLMPEAVSALVDFGFRELNLHKIEIVSFDYNSQSQRVAEKLGFQLEARLRQRMKSDDVYRDKLIFGLLREEWEERRCI